MTQEEKHDLVAICSEKPWFAAKRVLEYLRTVNIQSTEDATKNASTGLVAPQKRTGDQNSALHLWFRQIADICQNQGVTMNLIIKHTHDVMVTEYGVKALWHVLQKALYGTESTKELRKNGQIDRTLDHFTALFAKEEVVLPPFPHDPTKNNVRLTAMENLKKNDYPEYEGPPVF